MEEKPTLSQYIAVIGDKPAAAMFGVKPGTARAWRGGRRVPGRKKAEYIIAVTGGKLDWKGIYAAELKP